jgi:hypothetical protein
MRRHEADGEIPTLDVALSEFMTAEDLKRPSALTEEKLPTEERAEAERALTITRLHPAREICLTAVVDIGLVTKKCLCFTNLKT